jgi:hypothetical protein
MSNKPNVSPINKFGPPPQARPVQVELEKLVSFHCSSCANPAFTSVWQLREVPALLSNNPTGGPQLIRVESWMCIKCGAVWMLDQLIRLTRDQREAGRVVEELKFEAMSELDGMNGIGLGDK